MYKNEDFKNWLLKHYFYDFENKVIKNVDTKHVRKSHVMKNGYSKLEFQFNSKKITLLTHVFVWTLVNKEWPNKSIDHIDGNRLNNSIDNLRLVTSKENNEFPRQKWIERVDGLPPYVRKHLRVYQLKYMKSCIKRKDPYEVFYYAVLCGKRFL